MTARTTPDRDDRITADERRGAWPPRAADRAVRQDPQARRWDDSAVRERDAHRHRDEPVRGGEGFPACGVHPLRNTVTTAGGLIGVVPSGWLEGSMLPFALRRVGLDRASATAPFVAMWVDVTGIAGYFTMASTIRRGTPLQRGAGPVAGRAGAWSPRRGRSEDER